MLPEIPTLLLHPNKDLQQRLLALVGLIQTQRHEISMRSIFIERYIVCDRKKLPASSNRSKKSQKLKEEVLLSMQDGNNLTKEEIYLNRIITNKIKWAEIDGELNYSQNPIRMNWHYFYYLTIQTLRRTPRNLGFFISISLWGRSWQCILAMFDLMKKSIYIRDKIDALLSKGVQGLQKLQDSLMKKLMICQCQREDIPIILKRIDFPQWTKLKRQNIDFLVDEWLSFLCGSFLENRTSEIPILKFIKEKRKYHFVLRWSKMKILPKTLKESFQNKLENIKANVKNIEEAFINQIQQELVTGLMMGRSWAAVKFKIELRVKYMNEYEVNYNQRVEKSTIFYDQSIDESKFSQKQNTLNMSWDKVTLQSFYTEKIRQCEKSQLKMEVSRSRELNNSCQSLKSAKIDEAEYPILTFNSQQEEMMFHLGRHEKQLLFFKQKYFYGIKPETVEHFYQKHYEYLEDKYKKTDQLYEVPEIINKINNKNLIKLRNATKCLRGGKSTVINEGVEVQGKKPRSSQELKLLSQPEESNKNKKVNLLEQIRFEFRSQGHKNIDNSQVSADI